MADLVREGSPHAGQSVLTASVSRMQLWFRALRIKHWIKNFFVFVPFLMGPKFGWNEDLLKAIAGVFIFGLMSSSVYLFNDVLDLEYDRRHDQKRLRGVASGNISIPVASTCSLMLALTALVAAGFLNLMFLLVLVVYATNNILYSSYLKNKTVLDVMSIAAGFVLRVFAGGFVIGIEITNWLIAVVFSLSLLLGFGKRRAEYEDLQEEARRARKVHESYTILKLNLLLGISASITIVTYILYTMAPETEVLHGTDKLIFTTPFVVYCIYRFLLKVNEGQNGDPVELILKDRGFVLAGFLWIVSVLWLIHSTFR